jgi:hypothetical protein
MAGTLTISTLSDGTNSTSATNCIQGSAKAWVNYKGTATRGINDSYNVSSVTYNGAGDYTVNFTTAMPNANYTVSGSASGTAFVILFSPIDLTTARTTTAVRVASFNTSFNLVDSLIVNVVIHSS